MKHFYLLVATFLATLVLIKPTIISAASIGQGSCSSPDEVETALGCISTLAETPAGCVSTPGHPCPVSFFESLMKVAVGLGGGFALLLILYGVFIVTTSAGIPDKLKEGNEVITSAVTGLLFVILSVFLLKLIGINILGLPGLV